MILEMQNYYSEDAKIEKTTLKIMFVCMCIHIYV